MPLADLGDVEIYYESHGSGEPVLLVPGLSGVGSYWRPNIRALAERYRVVIHDHRGTGQSTRSRIRYSVDQMTDDLLRLMDHLNIERAHLVGHSTGGAIGQTLAVTRPERLGRLVLSSTWPKADAFFRRVFEARRELLMSSAAAYVRATPVFLYPNWWINQNVSLVEEREKATLAQFPPVEVAASRIDAILEFDRTADLGQIEARTLVLCARDDFITPPYFSEALSRAIPGARLEILDQGGHCASETAPHDFHRALLAFLEG